MTDLSPTHPSNRPSTSRVRLASPPTVTVAMPCYDAAPFLREAVDSILSQSFGDFEFLIADDASRDGTSNILARYAAADPRIRIIRNETNQGVAATLNRLFAEARGEFIARMDADDISFPRRFDKQVSFLRGHPRHVAVGSGVEHIDASGDVFKRTVEGVTDVEARWISLFRPPFAHPSAMVRRAALETGEPYDISDLAAQDVRFFHRLSRLGEMRALDEPLLRYREHAANVSTLMKDTQRATARQASLEHLTQDLGLKEVDISPAVDIIFGQNVSPDAAILALTTVEHAFAAKYGPTRTEMRKIRMLSARWVTRTALATARTGDAPSFARFLWSARDYLPAAGREAGAYVARRAAAAAPFDL